MNGVSFAAAGAEIGEMSSRYRSAEKFMALCRDCPSYGRNWACPPFDLDVGDYLKKFDYAYVFGVKIVHPAEAVREAVTYEKFMEYSAGVFRGVKGVLSELLRALEEKFPGGAGASAGCCDSCSLCARGGGRPCRHPDRPRRSLESLGFDVGAISEDMLGTRLLWTKDALPEYQMFVNGFFAAREDDAIMNAIMSYLRGWGACPL
ncbi:MAG: DUF2284 domain-containing protein [Synergistaceae bacterium]|nr:DUF2284 domain-containing protein [Synergistaceae bacterium]